MWFITCPAGLLFKALRPPLNFPGRRCGDGPIKTQIGANIFDVKHIFARVFVMLDAKDTRAARLLPEAGGAAHQTLVRGAKGAPAGN